MAIGRPEGWNVDLRHGSCFERGGFDVMEPDGRAIITVLWRPKERLAEGIEERRGLLGLFSKPALKEMPEGASPLDVHREVLWHKLRGDAKNVRLLSSEEVEINGHRAYLEMVVFKPTLKFILSKRMGGTIKRIQLLLVCEETARAFAIFGSALDSDFTEFEEVLSEIVLSFKCHI